MGSNNKEGAVIVIGGGITGIQAALDLTSCGFKVYLVEKGASIGGRMAQLDKTFPTNDCAMCILAPKLSGVQRDINIEIISLAEVKNISGEAGHFKVTIEKKPRYIIEEKCTNCGICIQYCPTLIADSFNERLSLTKCIHLPFVQAIPAVPWVDPKYCLFYTEKMCKICAPTCKYEAIDFYQNSEIVEIEAGAIILALGYELFDPGERPEYGYGIYKNVITSIEYERLISASGPHLGHLKRPYDGREPKSIAWIQCVGSRDVSINRPFCSSVCCMYATRQAILAREHIKDVDTTIFFMDVRVFGKGYEAYFERAKNGYGIKYIRGLISTIKENPVSKGLIISFFENGKRVEKEFDLVVLSIGIKASSDSKKLAKICGIDTDDFGFFKREAFSGVKTNKEGIYVCGACTSPKDIPDAVTEASASACASSILLSEVRGSLTKVKEFPEEKDVSEETPRIGVFICHCGTNIAGVLDIEGLIEYTKELKDVAYVTNCLYACASDAQNTIKEEIEKHGLNHIVVAACTPRTHLPVFQEAAREAGLNPYLVEMVNIREHCSWVHSKYPEDATEKAKDLIRMGVAKASLLKPATSKAFRVIDSALVVGGGIAGMTAALDLAQQGFKVNLIEKENGLGGIAKRFYFTPEERDIQAFLKELTESVSNQKNITVHLNSRIHSVNGSIGNFLTEIKKNGHMEKISHGVTILSTGAEELLPNEYLYGKNKKVTTLLDFEESLAKGNKRFKEIEELVMIQCVGSRNPERPYCSRICCTGAIKCALKFRKINKKARVYILYRDMMTYGLNEMYYLRAREENIQFIRYKKESPPTVKEKGNGLEINVLDTLLGWQVTLNPDLLILSTALIPSKENEEISKLYKIPLTPEGFFLEAHMKLRPVDSPTDGIFICGLAHGPKDIDEVIIQAKAAAAKASSILTKKELFSEPLIVTVKDEFCDGCAYCIDVCPFSTLKLIEYQWKDTVKKTVEVNETLCKGCGSCQATCPKNGIIVKNFSLEHISAMIDAAIGA